MRRFLIFGLLLALAAAASGACSSKSNSNDGDRAHPKTGEVFLDRYDDVGEDPFTKSVAVAAVPPVLETNSAGKSGGQSVRSVSGTSRGLYAGSATQPVCDATAAVTFLSDDQGKAQAWVDALNDDSTLEWSGGSKLALDDLAAYVGELTPVLVQADTRVTNHGFANDSAYAYQSVLQMGTAVMVDTLGVPRARCAGFNPLGAAKPAASPKYRGEKWDAFEPTKLVIVGPGDHVDTFEVVDMHSREVIEIATGSSCICDRSTASTTTTTSSTTSTTLRGGSTTTRVTVRATTTSRPATTTTRPTTTTAPTTTVPPTTTTTAP